MLFSIDWKEESKIIFVQMKFPKQYFKREDFLEKNGFVLEYYVLFCSFEWTVCKRNYHYVCCFL